MENIYLCIQLKSKQRHMLKTVEEHSLYKDHTTLSE
jgi:hypothetical protein